MIYTTVRRITTRIIVTLLGPIQNLPPLSADHSIREVIPTGLAEEMAAVRKEEPLGPFYL